MTQHEELIERLRERCYEWSNYVIEDRAPCTLSDYVGPDLQALFQSIEALQIEKEALRKDAERYRWLRHGDNDEKVLCNGPVAKDYWYLLRNEKLDAAIDAERATLAQKEGKA